MKNIKQKKYPDIEVDASEKDAVILAAFDKKFKESNLIHVERGSLPALIKLLQQQVK